MAIEIDLGEYAQNTPAPKKVSWTPPPHVYFGPRDAETGQMLPEPKYEHQEYPRLYYSLSENGKKIIARMVTSDEDRDTLPDGWVKMPGDLGYIGAPSLEQSVMLAERAAKEKAELEEKNAAIALGEAIKRRPGRPVGS